MDQISLGHTLPEHDHHSFHTHPYIEVDVEGCSIGTMDTTLLDVDVDADVDVDVDVDVGGQPHTIGLQQWYVANV